MEKEVKKTVLDAESEIYDKNRVDGTTKEDWKKMSGKEKFNHFVYYYLKYVVIGIVSVLVIAYVIYGMNKPKTSDTIYCGMFNGIYMVDEDRDELAGKFWDFLIDNQDFTGSRNKDRIFFETYTDTYEDNALIDGNYDKKKFDVVIANEETFKIYASNGQAMELSSILPEDVFTKISDDVITIFNNIAGKEGSYGIKLSEDKMPLYNNKGEKYDSPILFVMENTTRPKTAVEFIKFLYK